MNPARTTSRPVASTWSCAATKLRLQLTKKTCTAKVMLILACSWYVALLVAGKVMLLCLWLWIGNWNH